VRWCLQPPRGPSSRGRLQLCGSHRAGRLFGRLQHGASSPVCPCPSDSCRPFGPPGAGTLAESKDARSQSIWSASPRRSKSLLCSRSHTPASCHSLSLRQQVMPIRSPSPGAASPRGYRS
jgi:hypothetical protein